MTALFVGAVIYVGVSPWAGMAVMVLSFIIFYVWMVLTYRGSE